jgi:D-lactate dehydrogenase
VLLACVEADLVVIVQAANTGLTGGSTPHGSYDRGVVLINTLRIAAIHPILGGRQVVCLSGATLNRLERLLAPLGREPHSVIGSSCIGASVVGGVCNNSGGALVRRGPAYTEYALYAQVDANGQVQLRNHLGLQLGADPEEILGQVERGTFSEGDIEQAERLASDSGYERRVRDVDAPTPARFNANPDGLFEASGSAGRIMVFAVRLDTFPRDETTATFYVGTNNPSELTALRRRILREFRALPVAGEYIHREAFNLAERYGKDTFLAIRFLGTDRLPALFAAKNWVDGVARRLPGLPQNLADRILQAGGSLFPSHLPRRMTTFRDRYEHHLILKVAGDAIEQARNLLAGAFPSPSGDVFECTAEEATKAFLHRFAVAVAAVRYRALHASEVEDLIALDVALRRNDPDWKERLPPDVTRSIDKALYYGHFFCHVFHQDYIVKKGTDVVALEHRMWELLDARQAEYPAEHNVGHFYRAKEPLLSHYRALDPGNRLNPGIGQSSRLRNWH